MPIHLYRQLEINPVYIEIQRIFKDIVEKDSASFFDNMKASDSPTEIALKAAELRGRNKVLQKFYELLAKDQEGKQVETRMKLDMLDKYIDWEE